MGERSKCASCTHAHILRGFRESEEVVYCTFPFRQILAVPFRVREWLESYGQDPADLGANGNGLGHFSLSPKLLLRPNPPDFAGGRHRGEMRE